MEAVSEIEQDPAPGAPASPLTGNRLAVCQECGHAAHWLGDHLVSEHGMSTQEYLEKHPEAALASQDTRATETKAPTVIKQVTRTIAGVDFPMYLNVPPSDCLKLPEAYRVPQHGLLAEQVEDAALSIRDRVHTWILGRGGSGKDGFAHAVSAKARWPAKKYGIAPDADIQSWFFERDFDKDHAFWSEGPLLKELRDGYQPPDGGPRLPYMILITDGDRATGRQAEHLRLVLDSIEGRVAGPRGTTYPLFPGTVIVFTANTNGGGDPTGRLISARPQDATLMERIPAMWEFNWMEWEDEVEIVRDKFPLFVRMCANVELMVQGRKKTVKMLDEVGKVTRKLRQEIYARKINTDFSHRHLSHWLQHAERRLRHQGEVTPDLLARSARVWLSRITDERTKMSVIKIMDAEITGSMLASGRHSGP